jgi:MarR family transcriptional regulator, transcriptional regulator for hemolysin
MSDKQFPMMLFQTARAWRHTLDQRLSPLGLSQAKWRTLMHLSRAKKPLTQKELAIRLSVEGPTLVGLIDRLAKDQWVERQPDPHDRRSKTVHLTEKARNTLKEIHSIANQLKQEVLAAVTEDELEQTIRVLQKIQSKLESEY